MTEETVTQRLEAIRASIQAESVSYGDLAELQGLAAHIDAGDVDLLQWVTAEDSGDVAHLRDSITASKALNAAGNLWAGSHVGDWRDNEYLRGQVETLADLFGSPFEQDHDWDEVKDWYAAQIQLEASK